MMRRYTGEVVEESKSNHWILERKGCIYAVHRLRRKKVVHSLTLLHMYGSSIYGIFHYSTITINMDVNYIPARLQNQPHLFP